MRSAARGPGATGSLPRGAGPDRVNCAATPRAATGPAEHVAGPAANTQVLVWARSYPRRPDRVETVTTVLLAAANGLGHRPAAATVGLPATTVRDWIRRARVKAEAVRCHATVLVHAFDPLAAALEPTGTPLGDMLDAVGRAVTAAACRLGPRAAPLQRALVMTHGAILSPRPTLR